ncbi:hypothetical protein F6X38_02680 [Aureimonas leprariae]|uniref:Uncharacterized protein n=1 Tax=Plantimonas leprariae TaxID=2615207 RepID=A0A7V7PRU8_9HYPH|nr:hypothetical protein F6X38_02680 [Aureimonas leprariae]
MNRDLRDALFDAANRTGVTPNEFGIAAAAEKLIADYRSRSGVFFSNDFGTIDVQSPKPAQRPRSAPQPETEAA